MTIRTVDEELVEKLRYGKNVESWWALGAEAATLIEQLSNRVERRDAEILRLVDALTYAHDQGFEWPSDPLPFGSLAHDLFIHRGNDPERIEARARSGEHQLPRDSDRGDER